MKITEFKNEEALDLLAEVIEPVARIFSDPKLKKLISKNASKIEIAKHIIKEHKSDIIFVLATLDGQKVEEYNANIITIMKQMVEVFSDKELVDFFYNQAQIEE